MVDDIQKSFQEQVANHLIEQLKQGNAPWQQQKEPGASFLPFNPTTEKRYKGINALHLMSQGYTDERWMTSNQAASIDAYVRQGERGTSIQYWKFSTEQTKIDKEGQPILDSQGQIVKEKMSFERPHMFYATVFNAEQIDGLSHTHPKDPVWNALEVGDNILQNSGAIIHHGEQYKALYQPTTDHIYLPNKNQFSTADNYYATALRELSAWTGHSDRLDRDLAHPFGSEEHAKEKLRVEISSMILGDQLGIGYNSGQQGADVNLWIKALQEDPLEVFRAATDAEKIQDYVLDFEQKREQTQTTHPQPEFVNSDKLTQPTKPVVTQDNKTYINVPYQQKDEAKTLGAYWDRQEQSWYIPAGLDPTAFNKWTQEVDKKQVQNQNTAQQSEQERLYLAVPYEERQLAKDAGALWDNVAKSWYAGPQADMTKLERWKPENIPLQQGPAMTPQQEFAEALRSVGCVINGDHPIMDGTNQRIEVEGDKKGQKSGYYIGHLDNRPAGFMKNYKTGVEEKWKSKGYFFGTEHKVAAQAEVATKLTTREEQTIQTQESTSQRVSQQVAYLIPIVASTPYLEAKGIKLQVGAFTDREGQKTYIPAFDKNGKQWTMQYISEDGIKRFAKGGRKTGCFHPIGGIDAIAAAPIIVISEGYATAASVSQALGYGTVAAFDATNLEPVAKALREKYPNKPIIIAGDDDRHLEFMQGINPGKTKALAAAAAVSGEAIFPIFAPGETSYPEKLSPITPMNYSKHLASTQTLKKLQQDSNSHQFNELQVTKLKNSQLSSEQLSALNDMKKYTDFNDLATKSVLGVDGLERQVQTAVTRAVNKHQPQNILRTHQQEQTHVQKQGHRLRSA